MEHREAYTVTEAGGKGLGNMTATYMGQTTNQGQLIPGALFPGEGFASLQCGGTEVLLGYSVLDSLIGWICQGAQGHLDSARADLIIKAVSSICCEASLGHRAVISGNPAAQNSMGVDG